MKSIRRSLSLSFGSDTDNFVACRMLVQLRGIYKNSQLYIYQWSNFFRAFKVYRTSNKKRNDVNHSSFSL